MNFLVWQRGAAQEFDAWEKMGPNPGWGWKSLQEYFKKSATMLPPSTQLQKDNFATIEPEMHGSDGPVEVSFSAWYTEPQKHWINAMKALGLNSNVDGLRGDNSGVWTSPATLDQKTWKRSYSASAHYEPNRHLPNFKVITAAHAKRIILTNEGGEKRATGVEFLHDGKTYTVKARKEVVLSGGTVNSPALLELSGIGSPQVLKAAGVQPQVDLSGVGRNLQEHMYCTASFELKEGFTTWDSMGKPEFAATAMETYRGQGGDKGILASAFSGFAFLPLQKYLSPDEIKQIKDEAQEKINDKKYYANEAERESAREFLAQLEDQTIPQMEAIFAPGYFATASAPKPGKNYMSILMAIQHPFSRGEIHITSNDALKPPRIDPRYFSVNADLKIMSKAIKWCDEIAASPSLKDLIVRRQDPDPEKYKTEKDFEEFVKDYAVTEYHHLGTCSMMPKEKGGVVDGRLRVHGVKGLRVADASVAPLMPSSHIQAVVYAIAEKGATLILEDLGLAH